MGDWRDELKQNLKSPEEKASEAEDKDAREVQRIKDTIASAHKDMVTALNEVPDLIAKQRAINIPTVMVSGNKVTVSSSNKSLGVDFAPDGMSIVIFEDGKLSDEVIYNRMKKCLESKSNKLQVESADAFIGKKINSLLSSNSSD